MTRGAVGERVEVAPSNNIYTALAGIALLVVIIGLVIIIKQANILFPALQPGQAGGLGLF